jgi:hypothetical protein
MATASTPGPKASKVGVVRDAAAKLLGEHRSHAQFESQRTHIEQLLVAGPKLPARLPPLLDALEAILGGRRDPSLAQHSDLDYCDAAEILLLLETLPRAGR